MKRFFTFSVMLFVIVAAPQKATSQVPPIYNFSSSALESGTANTTGAVYRFSNVYTGTDALVTVTGMSAGITLRSIDRTADGYQEALSRNIEFREIPTGILTLQSFLLMPEQVQLLLSL